MQQFKTNVTDYKNLNSGSSTQLPPCMTTLGQDFPPVFSVQNKLMQSSIKREVSLWPVPSLSLQRRLCTGSEGF